MPRLARTRTKARWPARTRLDAECGGQPGAGPVDLKDAGGRFGGGRESVKKDDGARRRQGGRVGGPGEERHGGGRQAVEELRPPQSSVRPCYHQSAAVPVSAAVALPAYLTPASQVTHALLRRLLRMSQPARLYRLSSSTVRLSPTPIRV